MYSFKNYQDIPRMNPSTIVHGLHSMRRLKRYIDRPLEDEPTVCKQLGVATHALLYEPQDFEAAYVVMPQFELDPNNLRAAKNKTETDADRRTDSKATKYYKDRVKEFSQLHSGKTLISREQYDSCLYAIECIRSHHSAPNLLKKVKVEQTLFGELFGVPFKGRVDMLCDQQNYLADLKTTGNAQPHAFGRMAANLNYDFKLAIYRELFRQTFGTMPDVHILVQEIGGDYDTCVVDVESIVLDNAMDEVRRVVKEYKRCLRTGVWPGVDEGKPSIPLVVPNWKMRDELVEVGDEV